MQGATAPALRVDDAVGQGNIPFGEGDETIGYFSRGRIFFRLHGPGDDLDRVPAGAVGERRFLKGAERAVREDAEAALSFVISPFPLVPERLKRYSAFLPGEVGIVNPGHFAADGEGMRPFQGKIEFLVFVEHVAARVGVCFVNVLLSVHAPGIVKLGAPHRPILVDELVQLKKYRRFVGEHLFVYQCVPEVRQVGPAPGGIGGGADLSFDDLGRFGRVEVVHEDEADEERPDGHCNFFHCISANRDGIVSIGFRID